MRFRIQGQDDVAIGRLAAALVRGGCTVAEAHEADAPLLTLGPPGALRFGPFLIEPDRARISVAGEIHRLSRIETMLVTHLAHAGGEVTRAELIGAVWGYRFDPGTNLVAVHVCRIRAKLGAWAIQRTDAGYRLAAAVSEG